MSSKRIVFLLLISVFPIICLGSDPSTYSQDQKCAQLRNQIQTINQDLDWIYNDNLDIYGRFSNILVIDSLPSASQAVQRRLRNVYEKIQKSHTDLMTAYDLMCSK